MSENAREPHGARRFWYSNTEQFGSQMDTGTLIFAEAYAAYCREQDAARIKALEATITTYKASLPERARKAARESIRTALDNHGSEDCTKCDEEVSAMILRVLQAEAQ